MSQCLPIRDRIPEKKFEKLNGTAPKRSFCLAQFFIEFRWIFFKNQLSLLALSQENFLRFEYERSLKIPSWRYTLYRAWFFATIAAIFGTSIYDDSEADNWRLYFIYLTHWALVTQIIYSFVYFIRLLIGLKGRSNNERRVLQLTSSIQVEEFPPHNVESEKVKQSNRFSAMKFLDGFIWLFFILSQTYPHGVTIGFWTAVYPSIAHMESTTCQKVKLFEVHGLNSVLAIVDLMVVAIPLRSCQVVYVIILSEIYLLFTLIYHYAGGHYYDPNHDYIYSILEWENVELTSCFAIFNIVPCVILFFMVWLGAWGRMKIATRVKKQDVLYENVFWYRERLEGKKNSEICHPNKSSTENDLESEKKEMEYSSMTNPMLVKKEGDEEETKEQIPNETIKFEVTQDRAEIDPENSPS